MDKQHTYKFSMVSSFFFLKKEKYIKHKHIILATSLSIMSGFAGKPFLYTYLMVSIT